MNSAEAVILGSGGLGREVLWSLRHPEATVRNSDGDSFHPMIMGFLDDNPSTHGTIVNGATVIGGSDWLSDHPDVLIVVALGVPRIRKKVVASLRRAGAMFATMVSPDSPVGDSFQIGEGSIILPGAVITTNVALGEFVLLNPTVSVSHDCVVGDFTSLGPGVSLAGNVQVGSGTDIGTNASVIPSRRVGDNTIIGAGACVTSDIPDDVTAVGVPARVVLERGS